MTQRGLFNLASNAIDSGAENKGISWATGRFFIFLSIFSSGLLLGGCSALPDKPIRASMYDFGPGELKQPVSGQAQLENLPALAIDDISTPGGVLDNMAVLYRLAYQDAQELRPYALARWSMPPAQLVRQRLKDSLSQRRSIFNAGDSAALNRNQNAALPRLLRLELEEFSQVFSSANASTGVIRLRVTLLDITPASQKLIAPAQRGGAAPRPHR
jgi:cholesterol transport system auxiliary component